MTKHANPDGNRLDRLDTFVVAAVVTILLTRTFLAVTGYPQIGDDTLHIAHVLWGGLVLTAAFLLVLLSEKPNKLFAALLGGIGFGLFIDEVGKFVTQDNDYFYEPAIGIMYICILLIWAIGRWLIVRIEKAPFLSPAEWPGRQWLRQLIVTWCLVQFSLGALLAGALIIFGTDTLSTALRIPTLGLLAACAYTAFLGYGLWRYRRSDRLQAAHDLRGATLVGIVALYPFFFLNHPELATLAIIPTLAVAVGLSEVSFGSLLRKLLMR